MIQAGLDFFFDFFFHLAIFDIFHWVGVEVRKWMLMLMYESLTLKNSDLHLREHVQVTARRCICTANLALSCTLVGTHTRRRACRRRGCLWSEKIMNKNKFLQVQNKFFTQK